MSIIGFLAPRRKITINHKKYHIKDATKVMKELMGVVYSVKYCEPFDLVDIQSGEDVVKISIC